MIRCYKCGETKPEEEFNWYNKEKGQRQTMCRSCFSAYNKERYRKDPAKHRSNVLAYRAENPEECLETRLRTCQKNPTHRNANRAVDAAKAAGVLVNPEVCFGCGVTSDNRRIEAHHHDYSRPLDIVWLCTPCHREMDKRRRKREAGEF